MRLTIELEIIKEKEGRYLAYLNSQISNSGEPQRINPDQINLLVDVEKTIAEVINDFPIEIKPNRWDEEVNGRRITHIGKTTLREGMPEDFTF